MEAGASLGPVLPPLRRKLQQGLSDGQHACPPGLALASHRCPFPAPKLASTAKKVQFSSSPHLSGVQYSPRSARIPRRSTHLSPPSCVREEAGRSICGHGHASGQAGGSSVVWAGMLAGGPCWLAMARPGCSKAASCPWGGKITVGKWL